MFRRTLWWKKNIFENCFLLEIWANFFLTFGEKNSAKLQSCFLSLQMNTMMYNIFFKKFYFLFRLLVETFFEFLNPFFFAKVLKLISKIWDEHFHQKNFFWKNLKLFRNRIQTFSDFRQKLYGKIVRTVLYVFKNLMNKQTFSIFFSIFVV